MNNVKLRRIALSFAAVCFGISGVLLLFCSITFPKLLLNPTEQILRTNNQTTALPWCVPGTELYIKNLASYDGVFIEDGSNTEVMNIASVVVENKSNHTVLYAQIEIETQNQFYIFEAMMLPPNSQTLIPEKTRQNLSDSIILACSGWSVSAQHSANELLQIQPIDMATIEVINICDQTLSDIRVYHKTYLPDSNIYIGGIAIETQIPVLYPHTPLQIKPEQYANGYSKIVYVS